MTVRIGILGGGNISDTHARAARETAGVELVAYWARDPEKARHMARRYGGTALPGPEGMHAHRSPRVPIVGTPSGPHVPHARAAPPGGPPVLVEQTPLYTRQRIPGAL